MGYHRFNVTGHPFFGQCMACDCNGHSGSCDPVTGQCRDCSHNTTGKAANAVTLKDFLDKSLELNSAFTAKYTSVMS